MIIYRATFGPDDIFFRCDNTDCATVAPARKIADDVKAPVGWVIPRRAREIMQPQVTQETYCSIECLGRHDNVKDGSWEHIAEPTPEIVTAHGELPPAPEPGEYGSGPRRMVDARR